MRRAHAPAPAGPCARVGVGRRRHLQSGRQAREPGNDMTLGPSRTLGRAPTWEHDTDSQGTPAHSARRTALDRCTRRGRADAAELGPGQGGPVRRAAGSSVEPGARQNAAQSRSPDAEIDSRGFGELGIAAASQKAPDCLGGHIDDRPRTSRGSSAVTGCWGRPDVEGSLTSRTLTSRSTPAPRSMSSQAG